MLVKARRSDGSESTFSTVGENFALGLAADLFKCPSCGQSKFVEGGDEWECENCSIVYTFEEDESETTGYLHQPHDQPASPTT